EFYRGALLVDAVKTEGGRPGEIYELDPRELEGKPVRAPHFIGVGEALALGRTLGFQMPEELRVLAVEAEDLLTLKEGLSPKVSEAADRAVERALEILGEWVSQERRPEKEAQA
ncbi:MAG: hydrogenase maturation protease, partial [Verrucomicrobia bacterium]|nr:hydrogenase maturation protease [Verrucomicrobiota bacterium]